MNISENWLREWANPDISGKQIVADITMAGLEVDAYLPVAAEFSGVVVAEISAIAPHPDAEKLRVCQVFNGTDTVQVVCGAPNARQGLKVAFAQLNAVLPGDFKIKKAKLRGVESFGMLCGASELGFEDEIDGLMELALDAPVGADLRDYLNLNDHVLEVDLTPNRGDCLSALGLAREVAVLRQVPLKDADIVSVPAQTDSKLAVTIEAAADCPVYASRVIENIDISAKTPLWMQERLRRAGIRSIDVVVDITNYVMLELGQPMHAFDKDVLDQAITVRHAKKDEVLVLLNDQQLKLQENNLVIADNSKVLALAGIMGGKHSGVSEKTKNIVFEAAFFTPLLLAGKARAYGLHTDSSHRFERGVDWQGQVRAIERASALLLELAGGKPGPVVCIENSHKPEQKTVLLTAKRLQQVLGLAIDTSVVSDILQRLGFLVTEQGETWLCQVPSWRFDVAIEADLIEEIARIYGYNGLPTRKLTVPVEFKARVEAMRPISAVKDYLVANAYQEAITYSFIEPSLQKLFSAEAGVLVTNPISADMSVMRDSLLPGLVKTCAYNQKRQQNTVRLFETGLVFQQKADGLQQTSRLAGLITGLSLPESWANATQVVDFFDAKGDVENLLDLCGQKDYQFETALREGLHPGQTAAIKNSAGQVLGFLGALHPNLNKILGILGQVYVFELSLDTLLLGDVPKFKALSKYPQVRRDIALILDEKAKAHDIVQLAHQLIGDLLKDSFVFDVYQGPGIEAGKKSIALALIFQHDEQSLQDEDVQVMLDKLLAALSTQMGASLRV